MAASGERSADRDALVEAAAGAMHEQDRRSRANRRIFDRSTRRRHELARAGEAGARGSEVSPVDAVAHGGARRSKCEHAEAELVLRTAHSPHVTPRARRAAFVELLTAHRERANRARARFIAVRFAKRFVSRVTKNGATTR